MDTERLDIVKSLAKEYGKDITLGELIKLSKKENCKIPIEAVNFTIKGIYEHAYELTGDDFYIYGTIVDILNDEILEKRDIECSEKPTSEINIPMTNILTEEEVSKLASFFLGEREEEYCLNVKKATQSRPVSKDEIIDYLKTLYFSEIFKYEHTLTRF